MRPFALVLVFLALLAAGCSRREAPIPGEAWFDWFEMSSPNGSSSGIPSATSTPGEPTGTYRNPILPGFYPDPSIVRAGNDYYLVNSSFSWFPGIPVFHSTDLVNWAQVGHVFDRPSQLDLDSLRVSEGVFAPTIRYHEGTFYVVVTLVGAGGNVVVTAQDPAGPWSDPVELPSVEGIDPDLFFDEDGRAWIAHNGPPPGEPQWEGHRALWIQEFDPAALRMIGPRTLIVDGGVDPSTHPIWIEGPHLFRHKGYYYLFAAEGGTAEWHSEVVFRGSSPTGPFLPYEGNPILTQRDLPADRPNPVTSTGHADLVQTGTGEWWAVFLGCRPYDREGLLYNTGRETFLLPVDWSGEWPLILPAGTPVPLVVEAPAGVSQVDAGPTMDTFDAPALSPAWVGLRTPRETTHRVSQGHLVLTPRPDGLESRGRPALVARRQQHADASATTALRYRPIRAGDRAGLVAMQQDDSWLLVSVTLGDGGPEVRLEQRFQGETTVLASRPVDLPEDRPVLLKLDIHGDTIDVAFSVESGTWIALADDVDATILSTRRAGGFTGTMIGLFAQSGSL